MNEGSSAINTSMIEEKITESILAAQIRLRFDKSVLRLVSGLKVALTGVVPDGQTVIFAVTAPIKRRAKTAALWRCWYGVVCLPATFATRSRATRSDSAA